MSDADERTITMSELRALIKEEGIRPSELFETEALVKDKVVQSEVEKAIQIDKNLREFKEKNNADYIPDGPPDEKSSQGSGDSGGTDYIPD